MNRFGHVDLRVRDMGAAVPFYAALLPAVGFTRAYPGEEWKVWECEGEPPSAAYFALTEDRGHVPNANRIAFWAASRDEVDRIAAVAVGAGAVVESGPRDCPEYGAGYYAFFFQDPAGNRLEVAYRTE